MATGAYSLPSSHRDPNHWARPVRRAHGDTDSKAIYSAVGEALSSWEFLENVLCSLFALLLEGRFANAARAYGAMASARARYDLLSYAAEGFFHMRLSIMEWKDVVSTLLKSYNRAGSRRNDIAHGITVSLNTGFYLVAPLYQSKKWQAVPFQLQSILMNPGRVTAPNTASGSEQVLRATAYAYTAPQILTFEEKFRELAGNIAHLMLEFQPVAEKTKPPL